MPSSINIQMFPFDESLEIKLKLQLFYKEQGVRTSAVIDAGIKYKDGCSLGKVITKLKRRMWEVKQLS